MNKILEMFRAEFGPGVNAYPLEMSSWRPELARVRADVGARRYARARKHRLWKAWYHGWRTREILERIEAHPKMPATPEHYHYVRRCSNCGPVGHWLPGGDLQRCPWCRNGVRVVVVAPGLGWPPEDRGKLRRKK